MKCLLLLIAYCSGSPLERPVRALVNSYVEILPENYCPAKNDMCEYQEDIYMVGDVHVPPCWMLYQGVMFCFEPGFRSYCNKENKLAIDISGCTY